MPPSRNRDIARFLGKTESNNTTNAPLASAEDGAGVTVYTTVDNLPLSGNSAGDLAFVDDTDRFYIFTGAGWYSVSLINATPVISSVLDSDGGTTPFTLSTEGASTVITITATDSDGIPLTFAASADTDFSGLASLSQADNVFTVTPFSEDSATTTSGTITFTASDGIQVATSAAQSFTLVFSNIVQNSAETVLLAKATGNSGTNSSFTDNSSSSHTITTTGNTLASSFSPYRSGGYSAYFDGTDDGLKIDCSAGAKDEFSFGTGDFTIEAWFKTSVTSGYQYIVSQWGDNGESNSTCAWLLRCDNAGKLQAYAVSGSTLTALTSSTSYSTSEWNHGAFVRSGNVLNLYLNGNLEATQAYSSSINSVPADVWIGLQGGNINDFNGYIADARVVKGTAVYTSEFTPPSERLTAITNTSLLACHLPYFADGSTNANTLIVNGNTKVEPFTPPLDYDAYSASNHGGSALFDGTGDYLSIADSTDFTLGSGNFTAECWVYPTASPSQPVIFGQWSNPYSWVIQFSNDSNRNVRFLINDGTTRDNVSSTSVPLNNWAHLALVRNGSTFTMYVNGVSVDTYTNSASLVDASGPVTIGAQNGGGQPYQGYITDARLVKGTAVYTAAFTPPTAPLSAISGTSFLALRGDASIFDTAQIHEFTINGDAISSTTQSKNASSSMYFDGSGDSLSFNVSGTELQTIGQSGDPCAIEAWVYVVSAPTNYHTAVYSLGTQGSTGGSNVIGLEIAANLTLRGVVNGAYSAITNMPQTTTALSLNTWHHIAMVSDGTTWTIFIDGTSEATASGSYPSGTAHSTAYIGRVFYEATRTTEMYIEDLRITKGLSRYPFVPPEETLTAITNTSLLTAHADTIIDGSTNAHTITVNGDAAVSSFSPFTGGKSVTFDGSGDYLSIASDNSFALGTGDFTVEGWFYQNSDNTYPSALEIGSHLNSTGILFIVKNSGQAKIYSGGFYGGATTSLNQWNHIAWVRSSGSLKIFVNGLLGSTTAFTNNLTDTETIKIANAISASYIYTGYISNFRLVKGTAVYTNSFTPPTTELLG